MKLLVHSRNKLNAKRAIKFIGSLKSKLAIVHSPIKDEVLFLNFFTLNSKAKNTFRWMRVSGIATNEEEYSKILLRLQFYVKILV
ncbi:MAG: hypothetical protein QW802_03450 [Candidatus Altiarchaeota archaeon]